MWAIGCIFFELVTGRPLFAGDSDYEMLKLILKTFKGSEVLPKKLVDIFYSNDNFDGARLPMQEDFDVQDSLESQLEFLGSNSAISFARECLRMDPSKRPTCEELMDHDYFNDFREWFEDEIQTLIEYDSQE